MKSASGGKIALVHDYLNSFGGAEVVLSALHEIWPEAPIYTIFCKKNSAADRVFRPTFAKASAGKETAIIESWFGKIPFCEKFISPLRFLIPLIWKSFDFSEYDLVISSASWAVTKGFGTRDKKPVEICYCHTPPRYLYGYETSRNWKKHWYIQLYATIVNHFMRQYDFKRAQKVTQFIANSREVQSRIKKFYRRESVVINPPVEIRGGKEGKDGEEGREEFFLTGGRLEVPKNFDLIIKACNKLGVALKVYGSGPQEEHLKSISRLGSARQAGHRIEFLGKISNEEKQRLMEECHAFIVAAVDEDFGITPVEAMAAGSPVIAYRGGGYLETVVEGKTGVFFEEATVESLVSKMQSFKEAKYKAEDCRKQAEKFSKEIFIEKFKRLVEEIVGDKRN